MPGLWVYYCCAQSSLVPNRFFAMESARNRIMGVLMYLYGIKGFLHWGYNFYNSKFSLHPVDPYRVTHADYAFPSGDPFLVYPGPGTARRFRRCARRCRTTRCWTCGRCSCWSSLRARVRGGADLCGRGDAAMTFRDYPRGAGYLLAMREAGGR